MSNQKTEQFVVGGAVRDVLLGRKPNDIDFVVVGSTPEEMIQRGFSQVGSDFPVFLDNDGNEYALARKERKVGVGYQGFDCTFDTSVTIEQDLSRRDLTINSLAVRVKDWEEFKETLSPKLVIDPFNGQQDLELQILRHVSEHFAEDPVRVLRIARFTARYGFDVDPSTVDLIEHMATSGELDHLVPERVWAELEKAIMEPEPHRFFHVLDGTAALDVIFPELSNVTKYWDIQLGSNSLERFGLLSLSMGLQAHHMFNRLKAPSDLCDFIFKFSLLRHWSENRELDAEHIMWALKTNDCFRKTGFMHSAARLASHIDEVIYEQILTLLHAQLVAEDVTFADLSDDQKDNLKGPEISEAIFNLRLEAVRGM